MPSDNTLKAIFRGTYIMIDVNKIEKLMSLMAKHGFDVVQAESAGEKISLARNVSQAAIFTPGNALTVHSHNSAAHMAKNHQTMQMSFENAPESGEETTSATIQNNSKDETKPAKKLPEGTTITSPFVGTFYRSPGPDSAPFVELGSKIRKGQSLCIVEAMKLMNEIESEIDGEIVAILVDNAKPVEFGTPLFIVASTK